MKLKQDQRRVLDAAIKADKKWVIDTKLNATAYARILTAFGLLDGVQITRGMLISSLGRTGFRWPAVVTFGGIPKATWMNEDKKIVIAAVITQPHLWPPSVSDNIRAVASAPPKSSLSAAIPPELTGLPPDIVIAVQKAVVAMLKKRGIVEPAPTPKKPRTDPSIETTRKVKIGHMEWPYLAVAVYRVFRENRNADDAASKGQGPTPSASANSDHWTYCEELQYQLWKRTSDHYADVAGCRHHEFPWSRTAVSDFYMKYRKKNDTKAARFFARLLRVYRRRQLRPIPETAE